MSRPTWEEIWLGLAELMGQRSRCPVKVGAVIVTPQQRVISTGYAGPPAHFAAAKLRDLKPDDSCAAYCDRPVTPNALRDPGYTDCVSSHAEANAIIMADRSLMDNGAFYISSVPCYTCAKMIANTGVSLVCWYSIPHIDSYRHPERVEAFFRACGIVPDIRPRSGITDYHTDFDNAISARPCKRCGDYHTAEKTQLLNKKLAQDRVRLGLKTPK